MICINELKPLNDIFDTLEPPERNIPYNETDLEELRESIQMIITDFVENNIDYYKYVILMIEFMNIQMK